MQTSSQRKIGCIGKCTSGLKSAELDEITDNINKTLAHPRGRTIFRRYLEQRSLYDNLQCLNIYEACSEFIEKEKHNAKSSKEHESSGTLKENVAKAMEMAEDLDGVPEIDMALLERFNEVLSSNDSEGTAAMFAVLEDTKDRLRDHLRRTHEGFKRYASEPCPLTK